MNPIDFAKKHPVGVGIGIVAIVGLVLLLGAGGGTETVTDNGTSSDANIQAGLQLQALQMQYAGRAAEVAATREVSLAALASQETIEKLKIQSSDTQAALAANLQSESLGYQYQVSSLQLKNDAAEIASNQAIQLGYQASITEQAKIQQQTTQAILANNLKMQKEANKPKGLFSFIFG